MSDEIEFHEIRFEPIYTDEECQDELFEIDDEDYEELHEVRFEGVHEIAPEDYEELNDVFDIFERFDGAFTEDARPGESIQDRIENLPPSGQSSLGILDRVSIGLGFIFTDMIEVPEERMEAAQAESPYDNAELEMAYILGTDSLE